MKNFVLGIAATVFAGLVLFFAQNWYSNFEQRNRQSIEYFRYSPELTISRDAVEKWFKTKDGEDSKFYDTMKISLIKIENTGSVPISDQSVRIKPASEEDFEPGIVSFSNFSFPGGDEKSVKFTIENGDLVIDYKLLNAGDQHLFWITYDRFTEPTFIARGPDLNVRAWTKGVDADEGDEGWSTETVLISLGVLFLTLLAGAILDTVVTGRALKKRGYDLQELLKEEVLEDA